MLGDTSITGTGGPSSASRLKPWASCARGAGSDRAGAGVSLAAILLFLLLPSLAEASIYEGWQRVNASTLAVHERPGREYKVIDTLPLHLPVLVKESYKNWCAIDYRGLPVVWSDGIYDPISKHPPREHHGGYWVACDKLVPFTSAERVTPQIGAKEFLVFVQPKYDKIKQLFAAREYGGGLSPKSGDHFEVVRKDSGKVTLLNYDGNTITATDLLVEASQFVTLPWDVANNRPVYVPLKPEGSWPKRYLYAVASFLDNHHLPWWILLSLVGGIGFFASLGRRSEDDMPGAFLSIILLVSVMVGSCQGGNINQRNKEMAHLEASSETFNHLDFDGRTLPFEWEDLPGNKIEMLGPVTLKMGDLIWVPVFILAHIAILACIPRIIRGAHFLLSPPPSRETILRRAAEGRRPPPAWVSENWLKRLSMREERIKARIAAAKVRRST